MFVKSSGKLIIVMMGIVLSGSVGFGAVLSVDGVVTPADYSTSVVDLDDVGTEDFVSSGSDIDTLYWGVVPGPTFGTNPFDAWYTIGMTVTVPPINTTGDGTGPLSSTSVTLSISQGGTEQYTLSAVMLSGSVSEFYMWDSSTPPPTLIALDATTLDHAVDTGLEIAIHASKFTNLNPTLPFSFDLLFEGGGTNEDDRIVGQIPEPATMSMLIVGSLAFIRRRWRK
ncbi:MAG: PEP-CTERM sorting domain-containing protein [bacterium]|nr:PEP-CTERM sorting domain-containing protein [bacterium]